MVRKHHIVLQGFQTVGFRFIDADIAYEASLPQFQIEKCIFFQCIRIKESEYQNWRHFPEIKSEWLVAAAMGNLEDPYDMVMVSRAVSQQRWVFSVNIG